MALQIQRDSRTLQTEMYLSSEMARQTVSFKIRRQRVISHLDLLNLTLSLSFSTILWNINLPHAFSVVFGSILGFSPLFSHAVVSVIRLAIFLGSTSQLSKDFPSVH